jgi:polysaccharide deacetylase family protein (PEP-CTERM system associated)
MLNVLSVDVEDYFHVEAFTDIVAYEDWDSYRSRVEKNTGIVLDVFAKYNVKGTFFVLGWVAERFPQLIRRIAQAGHEVGCHGFAHKHIKRQTREQFRLDVRRAREQLASQSGQNVLAYRAPSFSIVRETTWALEVLSQEGFLIDSSIFPASHDIYGMADAPRFPYWNRTSDGNWLFEFPPSTIHFLNRRSGVAGGGYLRLLPYQFTRKALRHINEVEKQPAMVYFHPWEFDPDQPRIRAGFRSRLRHYTNLSTMKRKVERLLQEFRFSTLSDVCSRLEAYGSKPEIRDS